MSTFDLLRALIRVEKASVWALAECDSLAERGAVIELQRELPFLWAATDIANWKAAFSSRRMALEARLTGIGVDPMEATRLIASSLAEIVDFAPSLGAHARSTFLDLAAAVRRSSSPTLPSNLVDRIMRGRPTGNSDDTLRRTANDFVLRAIDAQRNPIQLGIGDLLDRRGPWEEFDPAYSDLIAAPYVAAEISIGSLPGDFDVKRRCREAWTFDPDYFDAVVPIALDSRQS